MEPIKSFRDLIVWRKAMDLTDQVYSQTSMFPDAEKFGLVSQMRRCAVSVPSNIAEGFLRGSRKEYAKFVRFAFASAGELDTQLEIAKRQSFISEEEYRSLQMLLTEIMKMLNSLINKLTTRA